MVADEAEADTENADDDDADIPHNAATVVHITVIMETN